MARKKGSKNYAEAFKRQAVAETFSGPSVAEVARRGGLNADMLQMWRRDARFQPEADSSTLLPVELIEPETTPCRQALTQVEVVTRRGHRLIVSGVIDPGAAAELARAIDAA